MEQHPVSPGDPAEPSVAVPAPAAAHHAGADRDRRPAGAIVSTEDDLPNNAGDSPELRRLAGLDERLAGLDDRPLADHPGEYDRLHKDLAATFDEIDTAPGAPATPAGERESVQGRGVAAPQPPWQPAMPGPMQEPGPNSGPPGGN